MDKSCKTCTQYVGQENIIPCGSYKEAKKMERIQMTEEQAREMYNAFWIEGTNKYKTGNEFKEYFKQAGYIIQNPVELAEELHEVWFGKDKVTHLESATLISKQHEAIQYQAEEIKKLRGE